MFGSVHCVKVSIIISQKMGMHQLSLYMCALVFNSKIIELLTQSHQFAQTEQRMPTGSSAKYSRW